jgi:glycosyltransferase involved in cell wall biosynthesis
MKKVSVCTPTRAKPSQPYLDSLAASLPVTEAGGWEMTTVYEIGSPYISHARSKALHTALMGGADAVIFIDDDLSWQPDALLRLLDVGDDVVAGTYRFKREPEEYMGAFVAHDNGSPVEVAGFIDMHSIPAGFLKITRAGVNRFIKAFPELCYGEECAPFVDLFNHGAWGGVWWGEDYAFARRWREKCGQVWLIPDLQIDHWAGDVKYAGNFHDYLMSRPGANPEKYAAFLAAKDG